MTIILKEPELMKAFKKRRENESIKAGKNLNKKIKNLEKRRAVSNKDISNIVSYIAKNGDDSAIDDFKSRLKSLKLEQEGIEDTLHFCKEELTQLKIKKKLLISHMEKFLVSLLKTGVIMRLETGNP